MFYLDKSKAGGKGAKTISPVLDGPNESDTSRPLDSEEIQALAIRIDELEKVEKQIKFEENIVFFFFFSYIQKKDQLKTIDNKNLLLLKKLKLVHKNNRKYIKKNLLDFYLFSIEFT